MRIPSLGGPGFLIVLRYIIFRYAIAFYMYVSWKRQLALNS